MTIQQKLRLAEEINRRNEKRIKAFVKEVKK